MPVQKGDPCRVDGCDREVAVISSGLCKPCYSALRYWRKASPTKLVYRAERLHLFSNRMQMLTPHNVLRLIHKGEGRAAITKLRKTGIPNVIASLKATRASTNGNGTGHPQAA